MLPYIAAQVVGAIIAAAVLYRLGQGWIVGCTTKGAAVGFACIPIGARSTGPALFAGGEYIGQLWLFWLAPLLGAVLAGCCDPLALCRRQNHRVGRGSGSGGTTARGLSL
jgi:glycerol uptake facilitator-like aquaporin